MTRAQTLTRWLQPEQPATRDKLLANGVPLTKAKAAWEEHFQRMPMRLALPLQRYQLDKKRVLDIGCGWGEHLIHFGDGSLGVEVEPERVAFLHSVRLPVTDVNIEENPCLDGEPFDAIWCSNLLEHVVSPHLLLLIMREKIAPDGLLFISIPLLPTSKARSLINRLLVGFDGYAAENHVSAFTLETAAFILERAGCAVIEASPFLPPIPRAWRALDPLVSWAYAHTTIVARRSDRPVFTVEKRPLESLPSWARSVGVDHEALFGPK